MKKKFFWALVVSLLASLFIPTSALAQCSGNLQSCDLNHPCCNFPDWICSEGYCVENPNPLACGKNTLPCCPPDPPNAQCATGLVCQDGYCRTPTPQEHSCIWVEHLPGVGNCEPITGRYCPGGFHPRTPCANLSAGECDGAHPCDPNPTATPTPIPMPACGCKLNTSSFTCDRVAPFCPRGYVCVCPFEVDPGSGLITSCLAGTCQTPTSTPTPVPPGSTCSSRGGDCKSILHNRCPAGYQSAPDGNAGDWGCRRNQHCCIRLASGCHPWSLTTGCQDGYSRCAKDPLVCCQESADCPLPPAVSAGVRPTPCPVAGDDEGGIQTALGCIPTKNTSQLAGWVLARAIAVGGGTAFLLMLWAGIQIITSTGDPKKLQAAQELLTSAITGLIMILFSAFLLQLIGVQILKIPGFGK